MSKRNSFLNRCISPVGFVLLALILSVAHLALRLCGWQSYTAFLSGTIVGDSAGLTLLRGLLYLVCYFAFVLAVPILLGAAAFMFLFERRARR